MNLEPKPNVPPPAVEPMPQTVDPLSDEALAEIEALAARGKGFLDAYGTILAPPTASRPPAEPSLADYDGNRGEPSLADYDRAFRAWRTSVARKHTQDQAVKILGAVLGSMCAAELDCEWVSVRDEFGIEQAVRSRRVELLSFPFSTVRKRMEQGRYDFLDETFRTLRQAIASGNFKVRTPPPAE